MYVGARVTVCSSSWRGAVVFLLFAVLFAVYNTLDTKGTLQLTDNYGSIIN